MRKSCIFEHSYSPCDCSPRHHGFHFVEKCMGPTKTSFSPNPCTPCRTAITLQVLPPRSQRSTVTLVSWPLQHLSPPSISGPPLGKYCPHVVLHRPLTFSLSMPNKFTSWSALSKWRSSKGNRSKPRAQQPFCRRYRPTFFRRIWPP